ncbi:sialidase family protein [Longispora albida]|uniref:sialidase family protein n=1 Tax=Longispora albida TaxID=203523 RepID=UPI00036F1D05|nr:sialidase family protein [Longispora albida]
MPELLDPYEPDDRIERALADSRAHLLGRIDQPALGSVTARVHARKRRRLFAAAGGTAAAVLAITGVQIASGGTREPGPAPMLGQPNQPSVTTVSMKWADHGVEIVSDLQSVDLPGALYDAEITEKAAYAMLRDCPGKPAPCTVTMARSENHEPWATVQLPAITVTADTAPPDLIILNGTELVLGGTWHSADGGRKWQPVPAADAPPQPAVPPGARPYAGPDGLRVRLPGSGQSARLASQPEGLQLKWAAPAPAADGSWWVTGLNNGTVTTAVSRDNGVSWKQQQVSKQPGEVVSIKVATTGPHVFVIVTGKGKASGVDQAANPVLALERSSDNGYTFTIADGLPAGVAGDAVPLADGRLLAAMDTDPSGWWMSAPVNSRINSLGTVGRVQKTQAGYVAYEALGSQWAVYSPDGLTWRRLPVC